MDRPPTLPPELGPVQTGDPDRLGRFRVVGRLGAGGMGVVYGAVDEVGRCVAVKTLHRRHAADPDLRSVFAREAELLARVDGVCAPAVRAADPEGEPPWMATDFVPGRTLRRHTAEAGPLDGEMLRAFAAGTAEALAAIHACGVVHRDIKPGNVILSPDGPKVVDFGIAGWEVEVEFDAVDEPADLQPLETVEEAARRNVLEAEHVIAAPECGEVETFVGAVHQVRADAWDLSCDEAMGVAEDLAAGQADEYIPNRHSGYFLVHGDLGCFVRNPGSRLIERFPDADPTVPAYLDYCEPMTGQTGALWPDPGTESQPREISFFQVSGPTG